MKNLFILLALLIVSTSSVHAQKKNYKAKTQSVKGYKTKKGKSVKAYKRSKRSSLYVIPEAIINRRKIA